MVFVKTMMEECKRRHDHVAKLVDHPRVDHIDNLLESMYREMNWDEVDNYFQNFLSLLHDGLEAYEYLEANGLGRFLEKFKEVFE
jgi:hypothetical protein